MPVILERAKFDAWLRDGGTALLAPAPDGILQRWPVSQRVNSSRAPDDDPHADRAVGRGLSKSRTHSSCLKRKSQSRGIRQNAQ